MADDTQAIGEGPSQALGSVWDKGTANFFQEREAQLQASQPVDLGQQFEAANAASQAQIANEVASSQGAAATGGKAGGEA